MTAEFLKDYLPIILFLIIALGLSCAFVVINLILSPKHPDPEKLSAYECGFEPFQDSRMEFDVRVPCFGWLAQLVEHLVYTEGVKGSSPLLPTKLRGCSSVG